MTEQRPDDAAAKLEVLIRLTGMALTQGKTQAESAALLSRCGVPHTTIAQMLDMKASTVRAFVSRAKAGPRKKASSRV